MKLQVFLLIALNLFAVGNTDAQEPDWFLKLKEIKVFESTKQDVERVFEKPLVVYSSKKDGKEKGWGEIVRYETSDGKLRVYYSTGKCSETTNNDGWDLAADVVIRVEFQPIRRTKLSEFNLDLTTFTREKVLDTPGWIYHSESLGIEMGVSKNMVTSIEYSLTSAMRELDCEIILKKQ